MRLCNVLGVGDGKLSAKKNALTYMINLLKTMKMSFCMIMEHQFVM